MFKAAQALARTEDVGVRRGEPIPLGALAARLQEIATEAAAAEDALEPALQVTVQAVGAVAGALCLYDERRQLLRLAVETGLSEEGCRRLRAVRGNDPTGWDLPLSGLLNRRVYVMENAAQHRYVPPLVEDAAAMRTVGCFPLVTRGALLGSLVLVAARPNVFEDRTVRALQEPVRELARMILAVRQRAGAAPSASPPPTSTPEPPAARAAAPAPALAPVPDAGDGERLAAAVEALAASEHERVRLTDALAAAAAQQAEEAHAEGGLAAEVEGLRTRLGAAEEALAAARVAQERLRTEGEALRAQVAHLAPRAEEASEVEGLRRRMADAEAAAARERQRCEELERTVAGGESARAEELRRALEAAREAEEARVAATSGAETALAAVAERAAAAARLGAEVEGLRASLARAQEIAGEQLAERERLAREGELTKARVVALEEALQGAQAERDTAVARARDLRAQLAAAARVELPCPTPAERPASAAARVVPITASRRNAPAAAQRAVGPRLVAVLDTDAAWERAGAEDRPVTVVAPGPDAATRLMQLTPSRVLVNLAAPGAFDTLAVVRAAGVEARCWGCVVVPGSGRALRLGMVEPAGRPIDAEAVVAALAEHATGGSRVFTAGADGDALISLRQALSRKGMSVSIAWDAKQATDLLGVVRPQVAVIDLELPPRDGFAVVARLALLDPPPHLVLVGGGEDFVGGFAAALADPALGGRAVPFDAVVRDVLGRGDVPPRA